MSSAPVRVGREDLLFAGRDTLTTSYSGLEVQTCELWAFAARSVDFAGNVGAASGSIEIGVNIAIFAASSRSYDLKS